MLKVAPEAAGCFKRRKLIANQLLPHARCWIPHVRIISPDDLQRQLEAELAAYLQGAPASTAAPPASGPTAYARPGHGPAHNLSPPGKHRAVRQSY